MLGYCCRIGSGICLTASPITSMLLMNARLRRSSCWNDSPSTSLLSSSRNFASQRMCSKNSRVDGCMFGFAEYVMSKTRVKRFRGQQVNFSSEQSFEEFGEGGGNIEGFPARYEFHEDINVTFVVRIAARE